MKGHTKALSRPGFVRAIALGLSLCALRCLDSNTALAQGWKWNTETVDASGRFTSLVVDKQGNVHLSYSDGTSHILKYAFRSTENSKWFRMDIDSGLQEFTTRIALDPQDNPHICYTPRNNMKYAQWNGKKWILQEIAPGGTKEFTCSLAIAPDGTPFVAWYQTRSNTGSDYLHIKSAVLKNGVWLARTIDYSAEAGKWNSMVMDSQGVPSLSYSVWVAGQLKVARWNGKEWESEVVDALGMDADNVIRGMGNSLRIDANGKLHVSYYQLDGLRYAEQKDGRWVIQKVDQINWSGGWASFWSSLVLDHDGHPHISYDDAGNLKHAFWDGSHWHIQIIAQSENDPYRYCSMGIAADDRIYISYRDPVDGSLKVAVGNPEKAAPQTAAASSAPKKD